MSELHAMELLCRRRPGNAAFMEARTILVWRVGSTGFSL